MLVSPGYVLIGNWRVRFVLSLLGQISIRCIVEELLLSEREVSSWKTNSHGKLLVSINSIKSCAFKPCLRTYKFSVLPSEHVFRHFVVQGIFYA